MKGKEKPERERSERDPGVREAQEQERRMSETDRGVGDSE